MEFELNEILYAFGLTLFAGLATGVGSFIAFFAKGQNKTFLSVALGFSAGVMLYVSFVEIIVKAKDSLIEANGIRAGSWMTVAAFFGGIAVIAIIDKFIPERTNPHDFKKVGTKEEGADKLMRMGVFTAIAIGIHNFPEGLATFTAALKDPSLGLAIAVAIAIHNIPEGVAVSVPVYFATGSKKKAFWWSFLSGLSEPIGALLGFLILMPFMTDTVFGVLFAGVAGIMVFISLDELLPTAQEYDEAHNAIFGVIIGMAVMAFSLLLFI